MVKKVTGAAGEEKTNHTTSARAAGEAGQGGPAVKILLECAPKACLKRPKRLFGTLLQSTLPDQKFLATSSRATRFASSEIDPEVGGRGTDGTGEVPQKGTDLRGHNKRRRDQGGFILGYNRPHSFFDGPFEA